MLYIIVISYIICFSMNVSMNELSPFTCLGLISLYCTNMKAIWNMLLCVTTCHFVLHFSCYALINNFIPWLSKLPIDLMGEKTLINNSDTVFEYIEDIIQEHINKYDDKHIGDVTDAYIKEMKRLEYTDENTTKSCMNIKLYFVNKRITNSWKIS